MIGVDEVGRGAWAGPLLVVASELKDDSNSLPEKLTDSKMLSSHQRDTLFPVLKDLCYFYEGWVSVDEINKLGLAKSLKLGFERALECIDLNKMIIIDGNINYTQKRYPNSRALIKADQTVALVSAASVYAKVVRDNYMKKLAKLYKEYGFERHVGYGTKHHRLMLEKYGVCEMHRINFKPIKELANHVNIK